MNLGNLDLDIVSDLGFRISDFANLGIFTTVESALQIRPFMQNEPNFRKSQMNVKQFNTVDYENRTLGERGKNEPNTNPKRTQNEPKTNPIYPVVASGEAGSKPISPPPKGVEKQYFLTEFTNRAMISIISGVNADVAQW